MPVKSLFIASLLLAAAASPVVVADEPLTGPFRLSRTTTEAFGAATADSISNVIAADEVVQFQVYVPESYDGSNPPGVFVYIDPEGWGGIPDQYWPLFRQRNLIWIGPKSRERSPEFTKQLLQVLMAERYVANEYAVDLNRLYVGGADDSVSVALGVLLQSNQFSGAMYINGAAYWEAGKPPEFEQLARKSHVFLIGRRDDRFRLVNNAYENYKADGIRNVQLLTPDNVIRGWPEPEDFAEALSNLDSR